MRTPWGVHVLRLGLVFGQIKNAMHAYDYNVNHGNPPTPLWGQGVCDLSLAGVSFLRLPLSASPERSPPPNPPRWGAAGLTEGATGGGSRFCCLRAFCLCAGSPAWRTAFYTVPCLPKPDRSICRVDAATRNHQKCASRRGAVQFFENTLQSTRRARGTFLGTPWPQIGSDTALQRGLLKRFLGEAWVVLGGFLGVPCGPGPSLGSSEVSGLRLVAPKSLPGASREAPRSLREPRKGLPGASWAPPMELPRVSWEPSGGLHPAPTQCPPFK